MTIVIRSMNHFDGLSIQKVATTAWHATYEGIIPREIQDRFLEQAYSEERLLLRMEKSLMLVATKADQVVGFANFSAVTLDGIAELYAIYLNPRDQGKGYGTALLDQGQTLLKDFRELYVNVEKENTKALQFYIAKGFVKVEDFVEDFDGHRLQTVRLVLRK